MAILGSYPHRQTSPVARCGSARRLTWPSSGAAASRAAVCWGPPSSPHRRGLSAPAAKPASPLSVHFFFSFHFTFFSLIFYVFLGGHPGFGPQYPGRPRGRRSSALTYSDLVPTGITLLESADHFHPHGRACDWDPRCYGRPD